MLDINSRIAGRVRHLRSAAGISLEALAGKTGVSRSMLSLIERGETSPTAVLLEKIATGLGVTLGALFDEPAGKPDPVSTTKDRVRWKDPQSGYVRRNISPANFPSPIRIVEIEFPAGAKVAYETGARDSAVAQQIWVREGAIEVSVGRVTHKLAADDCLAMRLDAPVTFRNRTRKTARYLVVLSS
ncbi:MAG TPA: XRE family transcriptional regulator [Steroidobacteraceae bacterium]|nr:XRE family transcriptional regulator [Steroidobacteraceae bacterium]